MFLSLGAKENTYRKELLQMSVVKSPGRCQLCGAGPLKHPLVCACSGLAWAPSRPFHRRRWVLTSDMWWLSHDEPSFLASGNIQGNSSEVSCSLCDSGLLGIKGWTDCFKEYLGSLQTPLQEVEKQAPCVSRRKCEGRRRQFLSLSDLKRQEEMSED